MDVIITLDDDALVDLQGARERLVAAGAIIVTLNEITGTVSAQAESATLDQLRSVSGVLSVEASGGVQIAPPDSPIQ